MNALRNSLITRYVSKIAEKQSRLDEIDKVLPDYENLRDSEIAFEERKMLLRTRRNLAHEISEFKGMVEDLKTLNDDTTPAAE